MSALKTLIVGFGSVARGLAQDRRMAMYFPIATHVQAIDADKCFQLVGVVDSGPEARQSAETEWNVPAFKTVEDAAHLAPDILVLAAPPGHRAKTLTALPSIRGVFAEKPLGTADGQDLIRTCASRNIPLQVNYWRRGDKTLGALAIGGLMDHIGTLQAATGIYGNGLNNNGSHLIDLIRMLVGEPDWIQAIGDEVPLTNSSLDGDVHIAFALGLNGGAAITVHPLDFAHYREVALDLWGTAGRLVLQQETLDIRLMPRIANRGLDNSHEIAADQGEQLACTVADALPRLYGNLHDAITQGAPLLSPGDSALETENIIRLIRKSAADGNARFDIKGSA